MSATDRTAPERAGGEQSPKAREILKADEPCRWEIAGETYYETSCGKAFAFIDDGVEENGFKFCPFCGRRIEE